MIKNLAIIILAALLLVVGLRVINLQSSEKAAFMEGCKQDMKEYECIHAWHETNHASL